jgi:hypothetical protein
VKADKLFDMSGFDTNVAGSSPHISEQPNPMQKPAPMDMAQPQPDPFAAMQAQAAAPQQDPFGNPTQAAQ